VGTVLSSIGVGDKDGLTWIKTPRGDVVADPGASRTLLRRIAPLQLAKCVGEVRWRN